MNLNQPYYIEPRQGENHIDLNGEWSFFWADEIRDAFEEKDWAYRTTLPKSIYHSLHEAGVLPDPYYGVNSKLYHWVDEKVWYYRKQFALAQDAVKGPAFLCFDGVAYFCRVWLNGQLLGEHEGMFGGPVCEVSALLKAENELIVEVRACNFGCKDHFDNWNRDGKNTQIVPWNIARDTRTSNGDFTVVGLWNRVRLEMLDPLHLSRPCLYTAALEDGKAVLQLEVEIADGALPELHRYPGYEAHGMTYQQASFEGCTGAVRPETVRLVAEIAEPDTGRVVCVLDEMIPLMDHEGSRINPDYRELQYVTRKLEINRPRLWQPNGLGEAYLYNVTLSLYDGDRLCDRHNLRTGVRTFTAERAEGPKYRHRWGEFLFSINGTPRFIKGVNWMPLDYLFGIDPADYRWCLKTMKNAGIQLVRVWNGGGMPETDTFYNLCDELGIMVWQDEMIANMDSTAAWPQDVLEAQIAYNLYRIRSHPSLVLLCGGNEFNPYTLGNAASMFVQQRVTEDLAAHILFHRTTPDRGSAHIYRDMEPVWYRHIYRDLPFVAESGIHSFPSYATLQKVLPPEELNAPLPELTSEAFQQQFPAILNHFAEYVPSRVPRMLSRASQIADLSGIQLRELCEATQVQAWEFYTIMLDALQENFPRCGGVMPWVFKRQWATAGIQLVDGMGQPTLPYYAMQNAYRPVRIIWDMDWSVIAPGEPVSLRLTQLGLDRDARIRLTVYRPDLTVERVVEQPACESRRSYDLGSFVPDGGYTDRCFLVSAELLDGSTPLAESTYFIKCTSALADEEILRRYRTNPTENLYFANGPWLKPCLSAAKPASLSARLLSYWPEDGCRVFDVRVTNTSDVPAYPVTVEQDHQRTRQYLSDNFFLLRPGESRTVRLTVNDPQAAANIEVSAWNAPTVQAK